MSNKYKLGSENKFHTTWITKLSFKKRVKEINKKLENQTLEILPLRVLLTLIFISFSKRDDFFNNKLQSDCATHSNLYYGILLTGGKCVAAEHSNSSV